MPTDRGWSRSHSDFAAEATGILRTHGPMPFQELCTRVIASGRVRVRGKTPCNSLYSILWRRKVRPGHAGGEFRFSKDANGRLMVALPAGADDG